MSVESKKRVKKLVSVLATYTLVTATRKKVVEIVETVETIKTTGFGKDGKDGKGCKYLEKSCTSFMYLVPHYLSEKICVGAL